MIFKRYPANQWDAYVEQELPDFGISFFLAKMFGCGL